MRTEVILSQDCLYMKDFLKTLLRIIKTSIIIVSEVLSKVLSEEDYKKVKPIILVMEDKGYITPKEAESVCGKSSATVRRYMTMLKNTGVICMEGNTNNIIYKIAENIS